MNIDAIALINAPGELPDNVDDVPDRTYISSATFAHLMGVKLDSFRAMKTRSDKRRQAGESKPGDIPQATEKIGNSPVWGMAVYREWQRNRPGKGAGGGRPKGVKSPKRAPQVLALPAPCPHCQQEITGEDVLILESRRAAAVNA